MALVIALRRPSRQAVAECAPLLAAAAAAAADQACAVEASYVAEFRMKSRGILLHERFSNVAVGAILLLVSSVGWLNPTNFSVFGGRGFEMVGLILFLLAQVGQGKLALT